MTARRGETVAPLHDRAFVSSGRFPGWRVVGAGLAVLTMSSGIGFYGVAVLLNAFSTERGWSVSSISLATTVFFLVGGVSGLWVARVNQRHDARWTIFWGAVLGGAALLCMGLVRERWQLFAVYTVFSLGWTAAGHGPVTTVVTRWFHERRASALAIASTGLSLGGVVVTPVVKWLVDARGIAGAAPWIAALWLGVMVPATVLFIRARPETYGWRPDGAAGAHESAPVAAGTSLAEAVRTRFFAATSLAFVFTFVAQVGAIQHLVKMAEERAGRGTATVATMAVSTMAVVGRFGGGWMVRRVGTLRTAVAVAALQAVALAALSLSASTGPLVLSAVAFGLTVGNPLLLQALLVVDRFGVRDFARITARQGLIAFTGTAAGPLLVGWMHDAAGGYRGAYLVAAASSVVAVLLFVAAARDASPAA